MKKAFIALLTFGALSTVAIPAQADSTVVIDSIQTSETTGDRNRTTQSSYQGVSSHRHNAGENTDTVMTLDQYSQTTGHDNITTQIGTQRTNNTSVRTVPSRSSHQ
ncbi:MAG: hypothetical protein AB8B99_14125 [Phormidesmis sp.]